MAPCASTSCYLLTLKKSARQAKRDRAMESVGFVTDSQNADGEFTNHNPDSSYIVPAIVIAASISIILLIGFLLYRIIFSASPRNDPVEQWLEARFRPRGREDNIRTISSYVDFPPTYRQVMKAKKEEKKPPAYHEVMNGTVNCGFVADEDAAAMAQNHECQEAENRCSNTLIHARTQPELFEEDLTITVNTADIFSLPMQNVNLNILDSESNCYALSESRNSFESNNSSTTTITVAEVNVAVNEDFDEDRPAEALSNIEASSTDVENAISSTM